MRSAVVLGLASLILVVPASGCIQADVSDGTLLCSFDPKRPCPRGYYCATNGYCYRDGHASALRDLAGVGPSADLSTSGEDMSVAGESDMSVAVPDDLATGMGSDLATD